MKDFRNIIFILVIIVFLLQMFVMKQDEKIKNQIFKPTVSLSTFSLYDIAKNISADTLKLTMILPFGVDAHSYEPAPKLMANIYNSDLVIYSGAGLEPWTHGYEFNNIVVDMSQYVDLKQLSADEHHNHQHQAHNTATVDPHYWLDISNMIKATNVITEKFIQINPTQKALYEKNKNIYIKKLNLLDEAFKNSLTDCKKDTIIVNHNAFSYLADRYNFKVEALSGLSPEAEPSAKNMATLITHVKDDNISTIFFESFVSDKAIKSIANEAKVSVDVLQPLGNITADEAKQNLSYEDIMKLNLEKISKALECK